MSHAPAMVQGNPEVRNEAGRRVGEILKVWSHLPTLLQRPMTYGHACYGRSGCAADISGAA